MVTEEFSTMVDRVRKIAGIAAVPIYKVKEDGCIYAMGLPIEIKFDPESKLFGIFVRRKDATMVFVFKDFDKNLGFIYQFTSMAKSMCNYGW